MFEIKFRVLVNLTLLGAPLVLLAGCAEMLGPDAHQSKVESARLEAPTFAHGIVEPEVIDETDLPELAKYGEPSGLEHDRSTSDSKADDYETEDDPRFVRETGFRDIIEAPDEVRETGFLPAPVLRLVALHEGRAFLTWSSIEGADAYVLMGMRYDDDGRPTESFVKDFPTQHGWVDGRGHRTKVRVTAVSHELGRRSKASNEVEIPAEGP